MFNVFFAIHVLGIPMNQAVEPILNQVSDSCSHDLALWFMGHPLYMGLWKEESSIIGEFSSTPCLITRGYTTWGLWTYIYHLNFSVNRRVRGFWTRAIFGQQPKMESIHCFVETRLLKSIFIPWKGSSGCVIISQWLQRLSMGHVMFGMPSMQRFFWTPKIHGNAMIGTWNTSSTGFQPNTLTKPMDHGCNLINKNDLQWR